MIATRDETGRRRQLAPMISESIGIPSHLSLPPFDVWRQDYLMTNSGRSAVNGIAFQPEDERSL